MRTSIILLLVLAIAAVIFLFIANPFKKEIPGYGTRIMTPEEQLAGFTLPEGFTIELVASEKDGIINPIDLTFDDAGRLWTQTARMYPLDPISDIQWEDLLALMENQEMQKNHPNFKRILDLYQGKTHGTDKILVISDLYGDTPAKTTVWADSLTIPMSILPYKNGAYVAQGSELFFLDDKDKSGRADQRIPLITGFGFTDSHTMPHVLVRAPGGWIYFSQGCLNKGEVTSLTSGNKLPVNYSKIVRFSLDAKKMELVTSGQNNIWGFQLRDNGQWYGTEANDLGYSVIPMEDGTGFPGVGGDQLRDYQPLMPELHKFRVGGTGISGLAFADDAEGSFPPEWKDVAILANPITSTINTVKIVRNPDGSVSAEHLPDLLTSKDTYFRPVNMEFGPDGCLYIADWYNKIISHNEVPTSDPTRDKSHGRIWRIRHVNQKPRAVPDFNVMPVEELVDHLKSPSLWAKRSAWHQIVDRPTAETKDLIPQLVALAADKSQDEISRIHALWCLEGLAHYDDKLMGDLVKDPADNLRREAIRSLAAFSLEPETVAALVKDPSEDANPMVRSQVLRTLTDLGKADSATIAILLRACKPELPGNTMGGAYERKFERYLALKALEKYQPGLNSFINSEKVSGIPVANQLWAIQALPARQKEQVFLRLWPKAQMTELDEPNFILISRMLTNPAVYAMVKPTFENPAHTVKYLNIALANQQKIQSRELSHMFGEPVKNLLGHGSDVNRRIALDAISRLKINVSNELVASQISGQASEQTVSLALKALENDLKHNSATFSRVATNDNMAVAPRIAAMHALCKSDSKTALQILQDCLPKFNAEQKTMLTSTLATSRPGVDALKKMYGMRLIGSEAFDLSSAELVLKANPDDALGKEIIKAVNDKLAKEKELFASRLSRYVAIAEKKNGDAQKGEMLFQTCLMCHRVGSKGQNIAPALDGSANRDNAALLTALLDPDAAMEEGFTLFRVTKKDYTTVEGYLSEKDDKGTTIAVMGGNKIFTPIEDIKQQSFVWGRSFMPKGLIANYSDEQVADLLAYIRTLK
ncbi:MAG: c-type cytochrome [Chitinophagaceae bacterium]|nr:c-type cytochrome [Chitinophagaceae bacterium]